MATIITSDCINCGACEPECPNTAIYGGGVAWELNGQTNPAIAQDIYYIVPSKCTECVGFHDHEACAAVCPVDCCIPDPNIPETEAVLLQRARELHPGESIPDDAPSRFRKDGAAAPAEAGGALLASVRVGPAAGLHLATHVAQRDGIDPITARALVDPSLEPPTGFLAAPGWTGGARAALPIGPRATARGGADVDISAGELVAATGSLELHDPCHCVVVRATAAHRIGRGGVDIWVSVDLPSVVR